jgi:hypothetical protein
MKTRMLVIVISFLLTVLVSCYGISNLYGHMLSERVNESLRVALEKTLVDEVFTDSNSTNVKKEKIESVLNKYNQKLNDYISQSDWEPVFLENWSITSIDEISSNSNFLDPMSLHFTSFTISNDFEVIRADKARKIVIQSRFKLNEYWFSVFFLTVAFVFLIVDLNFPKLLFGLALKGVVSPNTSESTIMGGESLQVEFKSTLRTNLHTKNKDSKMEHTVLKTFAAFLNSYDGGTLFIGVDDNKQAIGIDVDGFPNEDKMELFLISKIKSSLGGAGVMVNIKIRFEDFQNKRILVAEVDPHDGPVYLMINQNEEFYIRVGASTESLGHREAYSYTRKRWPDS